MLREPWVLESLLCCKPLNLVSCLQNKITDEKQIPFQREKSNTNKTWVT